jgi:chemotaxis regulatin CheY-phosphate phosphatase CheZ
MKTSQIEKITQKVEEIKALFVFGSRVMPFLEDVFSFIKDIAPLIDQINSQLLESSKRMPKASTQLNKVTEATEMATQEIMDMVDGIIFNTTNIQSNFNKFKQYKEKQEDLNRRFYKKLIILEHKYPNDLEVSGLRGLYEKTEEYLFDPEIFESTVTNMNEIKRLAGNIMISLQVQDITAQQIASVNYLIESVQGKIATLLNQLDSDKLPEISGLQASNFKQIAFDPDAVYTKAGTRQHIVDEVASGMSKGNETHQGGFDVASQDDIDALFK